MDVWTYPWAYRWMPWLAEIDRCTDMEVPMALQPSIYVPRDSPMPTAKWEVFSI